MSSRRAHVTVRRMNAIWPFVAVAAIWAAAWWVNRLAMRRRENPWDYLPPEPAKDGWTWRDDRRELLKGFGVLAMKLLFAAALGWLLFQIFGF